MNDGAAISHSVEDYERLAQITRLYLLVHGRPPDPSGLSAFTQHMRNGKTLAQLAMEFVASDEFARRVNGKDPACTIYRNAFGQNARPPPEERHANLAEWVAALVVSQDVHESLPILPALYPDGVPIDDARAYRIWLAATELRAVSASGKPIVQASGTPLVSFVALLDQPRAAWLEAMIASVLDRDSSPIELLIAARWRPLAAVRRRVAADPRLRLARAPPWWSAASLFNRALARCHGEFVALIGQHDQLADSAVTRLAAATGAADIVLTDDDALDKRGLRHSPRLGAAWDPDRVIASGCPGLILIRASLLRQVGGMRPAHGLEEWDMLLRASAANPAARVTHLPSIAISRRPTAVPHGRHPAHRAAARRYLGAVGHAGAVVRSQSGILRVIYPLPKTPPLVSIIIPTRDRADLMATCMAGLTRRTDYPALEILVIDNGTVEPDAVALLRDLAGDPRVRVLAQPGPFNWSALNNFGVSQMRGEVAVLLNSDTEIIDPGWLRELVSQALRPEVGVVGAKLLYPDRTIQHAGVVLAPGGLATHMWRHAPGDARGYLDQLASVRQVTIVTGACLAVRREVYLAVGGCDAERLPITWNDSDLCLRVRERGLRVIWSPYACLLHLEQATRGSDETPQRQQRFAQERAWMQARWNGTLDSDPFLNPNLLPSEAHARPHLTVTWPRPA